MSIKNKQKSRIFLSHKRNKKIKSKKRITRRCKFKGGLTEDEIYDFKRELIFIFTENEKDIFEAKYDDKTKFYILNRFKYRKIKEIGKGNFGKVILIEPDLSDEIPKKALKIINLNKMINAYNQDTTIQYILNEICTLTAIFNNCKEYFVCYDNAYYYISKSEPKTIYLFITTEYLDGDNLYVFCEKRYNIANEKSINEDEIKEILETPIYINIESWQDFIITNKRLLTERVTAGADPHNRKTKTTAVFASNPEMMVDVATPDKDDGQSNSKYEITDFEEKKLLYLTEEKYKLINNICKGVLFLHEKHIAHRDIKPDNIYVVRDPDTKKYKSKILDFGISELLINYENPFYENKDHKQYLLKGTIEYIFPELWFKTFINDYFYLQFSDLWAVGIMTVLVFDVNLYNEIINIIKSAYLDIKESIDDFVLQNKDFSNESYIAFINEKKKELYKNLLNILEKNKLYNNFIMFKPEELNYIIDLKVILVILLANLKMENDNILQNIDKNELYYSLFSLQSNDLVNYDKYITHDITGTDMNICKLYEDANTSKLIPRHFHTVHTTNAAEKR